MDVGSSPTPISASDIAQRKSTRLLDRADTGSSPVIRTNKRQAKNCRQHYQYLQFINVKYTNIIILFFLLGCTSSPTAKKETVTGTNSKIKVTPDTIIKRYNKGNENYVEKFVNDSMIERKIFVDGKLILHIPINRASFPKSKIYLSSGLSYMTSAETDTLNIINPEMPLMYRTVTVDGGVISWHSDTSYIIRVSPRNTTRKPIQIFITVLQDSTESQYNSFISDSLSIPVK